MDKEKHFPRLFITDDDDDDDDDRELISEALLGISGHAILDGFSNGKQLLDRLIIPDINMPIKDGLDTLRELKASAWGKIPVIMLTTPSKKSDEENSYKPGAARFPNFQTLKGMPPLRRRSFLLPSKVAPVSHISLCHANII